MGREIVIDMGRITYDNTVHFLEMRHIINIICYRQIGW